MASGFSLLSCSLKVKHQTLPINTNSGPGQMEERESFLAAEVKGE